MSFEATRYFAAPALYDLMYAPLQGDIPHFVELARQARGPVLEVGCGNGRVLIPCAAAGADIDGLDVDPAMLEDAGRKLAERGLRARLVRADMRDFTLPRRYALITIPFSAFLHNPTAPDQIATLRCCREHLEPGGRLVVAMFSPDPRRLLEHDGTPRLSSEHPHPAGPGTIRMTDAVTSDPVEQRLHAQRRVEVRDAAGAVTAVHEMEYDLRWVWPAEMELLLLTAGFRRFSVEGRGAPQETFALKPRLDATGYQVWTAWKE